jgi:hypothetical protein
LYTAESDVVPVVPKYILPPAVALSPRLWKTQLILRDDRIAISIVAGINNDPTPPEGANNSPVDLEIVATGADKVPHA